MNPQLRLAELHLNSLEEALQRLYVNYRRRLLALEQKMHNKYNLLLEREYSNIKHIMTLIARALSLVSKAKEALSSDNEGIVRLRLQGLIAEAEELFGRVTYGHVRVPTILRLEVFKLYKVLQEVLDSIASSRG